jgi:WD40 repeat protein
MVTANSTAPSSATDKLDNNVHAEAKRTRIEGPLHVLRGHSDDLSCCCVNADLDIAVTCSQTGRVLLHSITRGRLIRSLDTENVDLVGLSSEGILIIWNKTNRSLSTVNINGIFLTSIQLSPADGDITSIAVSADGQSAVIGTSCAKHQPPDSSWYVQQSDTSNELLQKSSDDLLLTVSPSGTMTMKHEGRREAASELQPSPTIMLLTVHNLHVSSCM